MSDKHLPLTEAAFEILLALSGGDRHGYAILHAIADRTAGRVKLHPGTLYRALSRMLEHGWLEELEETPGDQRDDERRRYYRVTKVGREVARAEAHRLASQVQAARAHLLVGDLEAPQ
jgi:DNA-binding PadR family transcriptional regulator